VVGVESAPVELWWCSKGSVADDEVGWKAVAGQTREDLCWATPSFANNHALAGRGEDLRDGEEEG
jgi:hypothetical protein